MKNRSENRKKNEEYLAFAEEFMNRQSQGKGIPVCDQTSVQQQVNPPVQQQVNPPVQQQVNPPVQQQVNPPVQQQAVSSVNNIQPMLDIKTEIFIDDLPVSVGSSSVIGRRQYQQDRIIVPPQKKLVYNDKAKLICILSDGMGGLNGGELASETVVNTMFNDYYSKIWDSENISYMDFFNSEAEKVNEKVLELCDENGEPMRAGATLIAVAVDGNDIHFLNVGDSRIYLIRDGRVMQLTHDQNYLSVLMEKVRIGEITQEEAISHPKKEALVSYCGIKELKLKEINLNPVGMKPGDIVLMCSDGLYRLLTEYEMLEIVNESINDMNLAAYKLTAAATNKNHRGQDNTSVILIKFN